MDDIISTGIATFDVALGGGIVKGRVIELIGPKTQAVGMLALMIAAAQQRAGGTVAVVDARKTFAPKHAEAAGANVASLIVSQPMSALEAFDIVEKLACCNPGSIAQIFVDLGDAPRETDDQRGLTARLAPQALRKLTALASKSNVTIVFVTTRAGDSDPYGNALKFYSWIRVDVRGYPHAHVKIVKNKFAPPFAQAEVVLP